MAGFPYQIGLLGQCAAHKSVIEKTVRKRFADLGYRRSDYRVLTESEVGGREKRAPFAALFFGYDGADRARHPILDDIITDSAVVLPIVEDLSHFTSHVPAALHHVNGVQLDPADTKFERDVGTILESFRLLRRERRLFISYKRSDASRIASQLYEFFDSRGFDVFLDTHGVPPGADFQSVLWHRLADSDVVILLDTPNFFESRWTVEELTRANATSIQILHVLWPGRSPSSASALNKFLTLRSTSFTGKPPDKDSVLKDNTVKRIAIEVASLRARAIAARHRFLVDAFCDEAKAFGYAADVQPSKYILLRGNGAQVAVVPLVGVPTAMRLHEVQRDLDDGVRTSNPIWALYDNRGLLDETTSHLRWLNVSLPLQAVSVYEVAERFDNGIS